MSAVRFSQDGLSVSTYVGPEASRSPNSNTRTRVQITNISGYLSLSMDQWIDLVCFVRRMDADGIGITSVPEVE